MKKLTLLLVAAVMISGGAFAQDKACCKKGTKCSKNCAKDSKQSTTSKPASNAKPTEAPRKTS